MGKFVKNIRIPCELQHLTKGMEFLQTALEEWGVNRKRTARSLLLAEEILVKMIEEGQDETASVLIHISHMFGETRIVISGKGKKLELPDTVASLAEAEDEESGNVIRNIILKAYQEELNMKYARGVNTVNIRVVSSPYGQLFLTMGALFLGILAGALLKLTIPQEASDFLSANVLTTVSSMFLNGIKMIVGPLVFFSISSSLADYGDMKALGRIGGKVIGIYFITSFLAILVGLSVYHLFPIGDPALSGAVTNAAASTIEKSASVSMSLKGTIMGIIPADIVTPFLKMEMLQIIFIAGLLGAAAKGIGQYSEPFCLFLSAGNALFSRATRIIIGFMPFSIFCSMANMVLHLESSNLLKILTWPAVIYGADMLMFCVYGLLLLIFAKMNPVTFFRKFAPAMASAFTLSSSNAAMPVSIDMCDKRLGISRKIYAFSIPLGATINMDGSCITQIISALFMAKIFQIPITGALMFSITLTIFTLSVGAPGVPGGALVCLALLLPQYGIPAEGISLIMGLYSLVGMIQTCVNVTGDAVVTSIVARSEGMIDMEKFRS